MKFLKDFPESLNSTGGHMLIGIALMLYGYHFGHASVAASGSTILLYAMNISVNGPPPPTFPSLPPTTLLSTSLT